MKKPNKYDNMILFTCVGIIVPLITFVIAYYFLKDRYYVNNMLAFLKDKEILTKLIALCAIPNLGVFMLVLNREWYRAARGVILATILLSALMLIAK
jgi:hypothetical protein